MMDGEAVLVRRSVAVVLGALAMVLGACSSGPGDDVDGTAASTVSGDDGDDSASAALALCDPVRDWENGLVDIVNATTDAVGGIDDPAGREQRTLAGYDEMITATEDYRALLEDLSIAGTSDGERAADDLRSGADAAVEVLGDERVEFETETGGVVTDADRHGRMGQFLISLETAYSAAEPPVHTYDDATFQQAVLDEPHCDNVVQRFTVEG